MRLKKDGKKKRELIDDGRVISSMNVEGMPWYAPKSNAAEKGEKPELTKKETRGVIFSALLAALVIGGVFALAVLLFILFSVYVWFA